MRTLSGVGAVMCCADRTGGVSYMTVSAQSPLERMAADRQDETELGEYEAGGARIASYVPAGLDLAVSETAMIVATLALLAGVLL